MTKYKIIPDGRYIPGLPASDLDDSALTDAQRDLLAEGVRAGLYIEDTAGSKPPVTKADPKKKEAAAEDE